MIWSAHLQQAPCGFSICLNPGLGVGLGQMHKIAMDVLGAPAATTCGLSHGLGPGLSLGVGLG